MNDVAVDKKEEFDFKMSEGKEIDQVLPKEDAGVLRPSNLTGLEQDSFGDDIMPKMEDIEQINEQINKQNEINKKYKEENPQIIDAQIEGDNQEVLSKKQELKEKEEETEEEKKGAKLFWGFLVCAAILTAPLGGGLAFLLAPAQLASFLLLPFFKSNKYKEKVKIPSSLQDKLISWKEGETNLVTGKEKQSNLLTNLTGEEKENAQKIIDLAGQNDRGKYVNELFNKFNKILANDNAKKLIQESISNNELLEKENSEIVGEEFVNGLVNCIKDLSEKPEFLDLKEELGSIYEAMQNKEIGNEFGLEILKRIGTNGERPNNNHIVNSINKPQKEISV